MKQLFATIFILLTYVGLSQEPYHLGKELLTYDALGFSEPVKQVNIAYYKADDKGYETAMYEIYAFNDNHKLAYKYSRIFGDYASETAHHYIYSLGLLDSLNTYASAKSFNSKSKFIYEDEVLLSRKGTGVYTNYEDFYSYDSENRLKQIKRIYPKGNSNTVTYNYENNTLDKVEEIATDLKGDNNSTYYYYLNDAIFAKYSPTFNSIYFYDINGSTYFTNTVDNAINLILKVKKIKATGSYQDLNTFFENAIGQAEIKKQDLGVSRNLKGDWLSKHEMTDNYGMKDKKYIFRKISYANGETSGSTDFNELFYQKTKDL